MASWDEISGAPEFNSLPIEEKTAVRDRFFDREVAPKAPKEHLDQVRDAFKKRTDFSLAKSQDIAGFKARPDDIQDSGAFWKDQIVKGVSQIPELSGTAADVMLNSPPGRLLSAIKSAVTKQAPEKSDIAGEFRKSERDLGLIKDVPAQTGLQRTFGKPVEFAAGSLPFSIGNIATTTGRKGIVALQELLSTLGGAEGADIGEKAGRELGGPAGGVVGALAGGVGGGGVSALAAPKLLEKGGESVVEKIKSLTQKFTGGTKLTQKQLEDILGPEMSRIVRGDPDIAERLAAAAKVKERIKGFNPDAAQATGSPVIGAMKQHLAKESDEIQAQFVRAHKKNERVLREFWETVFPKAGERPQDIARKTVAEQRDMLEKNSERISKAIAEQKAETDKALELLATAHEKSPSNTVIGQELDELRKHAAELRYAEAQAKFLPVYDLADHMNWREDLAPIVAEIRKAMRDTGVDFKSDQFPTVWKKILSYADRAQAERVAKAVETVSRKKAGSLPDSITQFITKRGGLSEGSLGGEFVDMKNLPKGLFKPGMSGLVRTAPNAKTADEMTEALKEAGYLRPDADINDMFRMVEEEFNHGQPLHFRYQDADRAFSEMAERSFEEFAGRGESATAAKKAATSTEVPIKFREFHDLMKLVNRDLERPGRAGENLQQLKTKLKGMLSTFESGEVGSELKAANDFWAKNWKEPFKAPGSAGAVMTSGIAPEKFIENAFLKNRERGAENWKRIFGPYEEGSPSSKLLYQGTANSFLAAAVKDNKIDVGRAKTWLRKNDDFLKEFPELRQEFEVVMRGTEAATAEGAQQVGALESRLKAIDSAKTELEKGALGKIANTEDTRKVASSAISNPKEMDTLVRLVRNNPSAKQGLATEISEVVLASSNPEAYMLAHEDSLKKAFNSLGPDHWDNLRAIIKGEQMMKESGIPKQVYQIGSEIDPAQAALGTPSSSLFSLAKGLGSWVSPGYAVFHVGGRYAFKVMAEQRKEFLIKVLTDPEVAGKLAKAYEGVTPASAEEMAKGLYSQSAEKAKQAYKEAKEELEPLFRLHGMRVSVNAANVAGREEYREKTEQKKQSGIQAGVQAQAARRLRELQGGLPNVPR